MADKKIKDKDTFLSTTQEKTSKKNDKCLEFKELMIEEFCYNNKNPFVNWYFNHLLINVIKLSKYWKLDEPLILDFGCNCQQLKKILQDYTMNNIHKLFKYVGYDIDKRYTDTNDYTKIRPDIIFCINVLEHLTEDELIKTFNNFRKMNKDLILVTAIPNMNLISNFLNNTLDRINKSAYHKVWNDYGIHRTKFKIIQIILKRKFKLLRERNYMLIQKIQVWELK